MAGGWATDGAVQEQIDSSIEDAILRARSQLPSGASLTRCEECDAPIPEARRNATSDTSNPHARAVVLLASKGSIEPPYV